MSLQQACIQLIIIVTMLHTTNTQDGKRQLDATDLDFALQLINKHRKTHNSLPIKVELEMSLKAGECAKYYSLIVDLDHSCTSAEDHGELLAIAPVTGSFENTVTAAINKWYSENTKYNFKTPWNSNGVIGHFTQLVWRNSRRLGFDVQQVVNESKVFIVALFEPTGNLFVSGANSNAQRYKLFQRNVMRKGQGNLSRIDMWIMLLTFTVVLWEANCSY